MQNNVLDEFYRIFDILNESLFENKIEKTPIVIQSKKKVSLRWILESGIVIGDEFPSLDKSEIPHLLLHQMIHIFNHQNGNSDITINQYHNKHFLKCALDVGLIVIKHKTQGWAITALNYPRNVVDRIYVKKPSKEAIIERDKALALCNFCKDAYKEISSNIRERIKVERPVKTFFLKYECECPAPHNSIRSGRRPDGPNAPNIKCGDCRASFKCVENL